MITCLCRLYNAQSTFLFVADTDSKDATTPKGSGMPPGRCEEGLQWVCGGSGRGAPSERAP